MPGNGVLLIKKGDKVARDGKLAEFEEEITAQIPLLKHIKAKPQELKKYLLKKVGDKISAGEIIAQKKNIFSKKSFKSPVKGVIKAYDEEKGILTVAVQSLKHTLKSPVAAVINDIDENTIILDYKGSVYQGKEAGGGKVGTVYILSGRNENVEIVKINKNMEHGILVGYRWSAAAVNKAFVFDCGVVGVEFEENMQKITANKYLAETPLSYIIVGRDCFEEIIKYNNATATIIGSERKLIIEEI